MSLFEHFHFLRPAWLIAAVPSLLVLWWILRREDPWNRWKEVIDAHLLNSLLEGQRRQRRFRPIHLIFLVVLMGSVGAAGPTWNREEIPFTEDRSPMVIALQMSNTMNAIDVQPTRLQRATQKIRDLLSLRKGSRTALLVYAGTAHLVLPLTDDPDVFSLYLDSLDSSLMPLPGNDPAKALDAAGAILDQQEIAGTILFLTDRVDRKFFSSFASYRKQQQHQVVVLGIGTSQGGPIRTGETGFETDATGRRIFSKLDLDMLKALESETGVPVATVAVDQTDVEWVQKRTEKHLEAVRQEDESRRWNDRGYYLTIPVMLLTLFWFRKGWTVRWA